MHIEQVDFVGHCDGVKKSLCGARKAKSDVSQRRPMNGYQSETRIGNVLADVCHAQRDSPDKHNEAITTQFNRWLCIDRQDTEHSIHAHPQSGVSCASRKSATRTTYGASYLSTYESDKIARSASHRRETAGFKGDGSELAVLLRRLKAFFPQRRRGDAERE